ncbi:DUF5685 family protein [Gordonia sp. VNQ95]|uniref:DUF5685 family protein n=1 Tax=Gordonia sp. VNQ95 TaxID=3156619 RepID=UPI0032B53567
MFGVLQPCRHTLDDELADLWRAHLCGLCLELRDSHGQASRLTTNTDAVMISVLTAAQRSVPAELTTAGRCPLRGMRRAEVMVGAEPGIRLAATASLTLAAGKAADIPAEQTHGLAPRSRVRAAAAGVAARRLHRAATRSASSSTDLSIDDMMATLARQADIESTSTDLHEILSPATQVCADVFAATADAAGVPGNRDHLAAIGADFGAIAHLLDAVDDYDTDLTEGVFNPLRATDTDVASALADCRRLAKAIRRRYDLLHLDDDRLLRAVLLDGLHRAISRRSRSHGLVSLCHNHSPESAYPNPTGWPPFPPPDYPESWPYPPPFRPNRGFLERLGPFVWTTCSGQACCTDHWNHCSDKWKNECCDCDDCDCDCCDCDCCDCP